MKTRTTKEKRELLSRFIELQVLLGYPIQTFIGRPLNYYDYDRIEQAVAAKELQYSQAMDVYHEGHADYVPAFR